MLCLNIGNVAIITVKNVDYRCIMSDKAVDPSTIKLVPGWYKTKEMCHRAVHRCFFVFDSIPDKYKTQ